MMTTSRTRLQFYYSAGLPFDLVLFLRLSVRPPSRLSKNSIIWIPVDDARRRAVCPSSSTNLPISTRLFTYLSELTSLHAFLRLPRRFHVVYYEQITTSLVPSRCTIPFQPVHSAPFPSNLPKTFHVHAFRRIRHLSLLFVPMPDRRVKRFS